MGPAAYVRTAAFWSSPVPDSPAFKKSHLSMLNVSYTETAMAFLDALRTVTFSNEPETERPNIPYSQMSITTSGTQTSTARSRFIAV
ncbi:hypothetical protein D3C76_993870 [compost metagenome]